MNICFAIGTLNYSGAEKIMFHLIREFYKRGHSVSVILIASTTETPNLEGIVQYPILRKEEDVEGRVVRALKRQKIIRRIIRNNNFDVVACFGTMFNVDVAEACLFIRTKLILCERNDPVFDPKTSIKRIRRNISYNRGNGFVFQTREQQAFFSKRIQARSTVIPNFMDSVIQQDMKYHPKYHSITTSCRIDNYQKDLSTLFSAFKKFVKEHSDYKLELYGDGPDIQEMQALVKKLQIEDYVIFKGRVNNPMEFIRLSEMFVLSTNYEGMPNALIEAMSYGMPCISSDCGGGGARALINDGKNGFLFSIGDEDALSDKMSLLADSRELAKKMGNEAYKINQTLAIDKIIPLWEKYFESIIKR